MKIRSIVVLAIAIPVALYQFAGIGKPSWWGKDTVIKIATADPHLIASKTHAVATLDQFLDVALAKRPGTSKYAVKIPLTDGTETEVFWVKQIARTANGRFTGRIDNTPTLVHSVKLDQEITFARDQIVDWTYLERGRMVGNFTICVLLNETTVPKLSEVQDKFGVDCTWQKLG